VERFLDGTGSCSTRRAHAIGRRCCGGWRGRRSRRTRSSTNAG
jgi:hypothetical protein